MPSDEEPVAKAIQFDLSKGTVVSCNDAQSRVLVRFPDRFQRCFQWAPIDVIREKFAQLHSLCFSPEHAITVASLILYLVEPVCCLICLT